MKLLIALSVTALIVPPAFAQTAHEHGHGPAPTPPPLAQAPASPGGQTGSSPESQPSSPAVGAADPHAGHTMPAVEDGPWSYKGRKNPEPITRGRVEVVPAATDKMQYVDATRLSPQARCEALLASDHVAVDRATRAACARPAAPAPAAPAGPSGHAGH